MNLFVLQEIAELTLSSDHTDTNLSNKSQTRKGKVDLCCCGKCQAMETEIESLCYRDTNEAPSEYFEGFTCITESQGFHTVCLAENVLKTALSAFNHFRGDSLDHLNNRAYRFAGYKQYII